jgi:hypothetical protein
VVAAIDSSFATNTHRKKCGMNAVDAIPHEGIGQLTAPLQLKEKNNVVSYQYRNQAVQGHRVS